MKYGALDIRNCDCMEMMREFPDRHFHLCIVDPPYGIGEDGLRNHSRGNKALAKKYKPYANGKSKPSNAYFDELFRVSKHQIIWGANHFISRFARDSSCWLVWDKENGNSDFADCELAWSSFRMAVRKFSFMWHGMLQGNMKNKEERIHPNQKPVALYNWILNKYSAPGQRILDTHMGSGSIAIACHYFGADLTACELDAYYYNAAMSRIARETRQEAFL